LRFTEIQSRRSASTPNKEVNTLEKFQEALNQSVNVLVLLSHEFEKLEATHSDVLSEGYPLSQDLREVVHKLIEWRDSISEGR
jgi:hypothetical protein